MGATATVQTAAPDPEYIRAGSACFHCGLPVPAGVSHSVALDGEPRAMCCAGCAAVAEAILAAGLADYYRHRNALPANPHEAVPGFLRRLDLYDLPDVQASFVRAEGGTVREAALILEGITCAACIWLNERHLSRLPGVLAVDINYATHRARLRWDDSRIRLSDILRAVAAIGYTAHPFDPAKREEVAARERRAMLRRLAIAGLGMMQVMMYAIPAYIAGDGEMSADVERLLRWASLVLTLPVVLYSAAPFFAGAWRDLKLRAVGMDLPVAIGIVVAFAASTWATLGGSGDVYFDSMSMFVFLLLLGRYLELRARGRAGDAAENLAKLAPATAGRLPDYPASDRCEEVAVGSLKAGDFVLVRPGDTVPADGRLLSGAGEVDESLLSGESRPVAKRCGDTLTGGAVNLSAPLVMRVERVGQDTVLAGISRLLDRALSEKPRVAALAERVARWFVALVLVTAAAAGTAWFFVDPSRALWIAVAVLVVTCPCALSLATPVVLTAATGRLTREGLLVTRGHALETLARATHFVFDKTGTLTRGRMALASVTPLGALSRDECLRLAGRLESRSEHPIACALREAAPEAETAVPVRDLHNEPGSGFEGTADGLRLRLGTPHFAGLIARQPMPQALAELIARGETVIALAGEGGWLAALVLEDEVRADAAALVRDLKRLGRRVHLLSGDAPEAARRLANRVGIETVHGGASPEEKLAYVRALQERGAVVVMVGDGVNDAPVLAQAQVSVAMGEGTEVAQASADMVLLSGRLSGLGQGVRISRAARAVIRQNLAWAFAYNVVALPLAVSGQVTPWIAGIGMALSSLVVVLNALRLTGGQRSVVSGQSSVPGAVRQAPAGSCLLATDN
ncbi:MAG TPA: heavy metal translocating P-type ATPase [Burkholderiales bacterium]|nr:heavy metal translocating P-type ATPase [Burkholderiales bacterium]